MEVLFLVLLAVLDLVLLLMQQPGLGIWLFHRVAVYVPAALEEVHTREHTEELVVYRRPTLTNISQDSGVIKHSIQCTDREEERSKFVAMGMEYNGGVKMKTNINAYTL